jgi:apolipoprotein N-acyltransferase
MQKISALLHRFPRWSAMGAGAASAYGFEPWGLWPLTLACFALLIHLIAHAQNTKRAFILGWLFGVGHFTFGNQWIAVAFTFQAIRARDLLSGDPDLAARYIAPSAALKRFQS